MSFERRQSAVKVIGRVSSLAAAATFAAALSVTAAAAPSVASPSVDEAAKPKMIKVSTDPYENSNAYHQTELEPV